jgi:signal peptidase
MNLLKKKDATAPATEETKDVNPDKPEQKKGVKIALKVGNIIINTLIVVVLITSIVIAALALTSKANGGVPQLFGYSFHTVMSPSMEGGSTQYEGGSYNVGDLVIGKVTNGNTNEIYEIGDIVVYTTKNDNTPDGVEMIVHRVIAREDDGNGKFIYTTKGDNNPVEDSAKHSAAEIIAVCYDHNYHGAVWRGFGAVLNYLRSSQGFFLVVLLPMIIFFLYEIIRVVLNALNYKKSKSEEDKADLEREKQEAVEAAVKAALAAVGKTDAPESAPADPAPADEPAEAPAVADTPEKSAAPEMTAEQLEQFKQFLAFQEAQKAAQNTPQPADEQPGE